MLWLKVRMNDILKPTVDKPVNVRVFIQNVAGLMTLVCFKCSVIAVVGMLDCVPVRVQLKVRLPYWLLPSSGVMVNLKLPIGEQGGTSGAGTISS